MKLLKKLQFSFGWILITCLISKRLPEVGWFSFAFFSENSVCFFGVSNKSFLSILISVFNESRKNWLTTFDGFSFNLQTADVEVEEQTSWSELLSNFISLKGENTVGSTSDNSSGSNFNFFGRTWEFSENSVLVSSEDFFSNSGVS